MIGPQQIVRELSEADLFIHPSIIDNSPNALCEAQLVGCPVCPADAAPEIKAISRYVSPFVGGQGAARDVIEQVLKAQGQWMSDKIAFGW